MKELLYKIPISTAIIIYLFICGILYITGFWGTFNVDAFNLISIYDIPKSFVFPLIITQGIFIMHFISGIIVEFDDNRKNINYLITIKEEWSLGKKFILAFLTSTNFLVITILIISIVSMEDFLYNISFWAINSTIISYYLLHRFVNISSFRKIVKSSLLRAYIGHITIILPISCFASGKVISLRIYHNKNITVVNSIPKNHNSSSNIKSKPYKFLGFISDNIVYSSLNNNEIYILSKESVDGIVINKIK